MRSSVHLLAVIIVLTAATGCDSFRRVNSQPDAVVESSHLGQEIPRTESERLRRSARIANHASWVSALVSAGLWLAYANSDDSGELDDRYAVAAGAAGFLSFVSLYYSISKTIAAQEAAERELTASIERFAREQQR